MKYQDKRFSVGGYSREFAEGYERTFGKAPPARKPAKKLPRKRPEKGGAK